MGQDTVTKITAKLYDCLPHGRVKKVVAVTRANSTIFQDLSKTLQSNAKDSVEISVISRDAPAPSVDGRWLKGSTSTYQARPLLGDVFKTAQRLGKIEPNIATYTDYLKTLDGDNQQSSPQPIDTIKDEVLTDQIDLLVCDDGSFEGLGLVEALWGAKAILVTQVKESVGPNWVFEKLFNAPLYDLVYSDDTFAGGTSLFVAANVERRQLPVHFFTIVLNGEPFIRYHEEMLSKLRCDWHWHVIEGVADLVKDTAWSVAAGGNIPASLHHLGRSNDGTTEYLDDLKARFPNNVTIYRKPDNVFWHGKQEMVAAPIPFIKEHCLLWQVDADELWTAPQVERMREMFLNEPDRTAAFFWCNYYVGPTRGISTRYCYAQNPNVEWLRVWQFEPGMVWEKHEPPVLAKTDPDTGALIDMGHANPFKHLDTEREGLVFDHFAYVTAEQARFKESYYGYKNAVDQWQALQAHKSGSGLLKDYFAWVSDNTMFDTAERLGWNPLAFVDEKTNSWHFRSQPSLKQSSAKAVALPAARDAAMPNKKPKIIVDGIFHQLSASGIARLWNNQMRAWVESGVADRVVMLDRGGTAPRIDGVIYHTIPKLNTDDMLGDSRLLEETCQLLGGDIFISTYYTTPTKTPTIFYGYDMIPEIIGKNLEDVWWQQKRAGIQFADGHIMISKFSAKEMCRFHPYIDPKSVLVAYCSIDPVFSPVSEKECQQFKEKYNITRDFVILVGERMGWEGYKNGTVVFAALGSMKKEDRPLLVCVGGNSELEPEGKAFLDQDDWLHLKLDDVELRQAYGASFAYICSSTLEGFGLPVGEAMTVGTPAVIGHTSSIPEVAGEAGVYFDINNPVSLVEKLVALKDPGLRRAVIEKGRKEITKFNQARTAQEVADYCDMIFNRRVAAQTEVSNSALEDLQIIRVQERASERGAAQLRQQMFELKVQLSQSGTVRAPAGESTTIPTPFVDSDYARMLEQRMLKAYQHIRDLDNQIKGLKQAEPPHPTDTSDANSQLAEALNKLATAEAQNLDLVERLNELRAEQKTSLQRQEAAADKQDEPTVHEFSSRNAISEKIEPEKPEQSAFTPNLAQALNEAGAPRLSAIKPPANLGLLAPRTIRPKGIPALPEPISFGRSSRFRMNKLKRFWLTRNIGVWFSPDWYSRHYGLSGQSAAQPLHHFATIGILENHSPSPLFDSQFYLKQNPDVAESGVPAFWHFLSRGIKENRQPNWFFEPEFYLNAYPDLKGSKQGPLKHFAVSGMKEGRKGSVLFDPTYYMEQNPDLHAAGVNAYQHFMEFGIAEGRSPTALFDRKFYTKAYPEVELSGLSSFEHFVKIGIQADYQPNALFDPEFYVERYADVRLSETSAFAHFIQYGLAEGRQPHPLFDSRFYAATYPDVVNSSLPPYLHFLQYGMQEDRRPHPLFDPDFYKRTYAEVQNSKLVAFEHFLKIGLFKGYSPNALFSPERYARLYGEKLRLDMPVVEQYLRYGISL
ncbi:MAG: hypothetical protein CFE27_01765 [Alphaproteobacteria bacterium PA1]|nr:MAG: hypothetical protein CFE27_01765 [Alphaproteobacteria bacterium PA1]